MAQHHVMGDRVPVVPERQVRRRDHEPWEAKMRVLQDTVMDTDGIMTDEDLLTPTVSSTPPPSANQQRNSVFTFANPDEEPTCWTRFLDAVINFLMFFVCCRNIR